MQQFVIKALVDGAMVFGLVLQKGVIINIDVETSRMSSLQALVDAGTIEVQGMAVTPPAAPAKADKK